MSKHGASKTLRRPIEPVDKSGDRPDDRAMPHNGLSLPPKPFTNPVVLALDVDTREEALRVADQVGDIVGGIKLGPRLCLRYGKSFVEEMAARAPVFLDNKHFDIPSTMEAAVRASFDAGASVVTVHALAGKEALRKMAEVETELNMRRPFRILSVTILTSWSHESMPPVLKEQKLSDHVVELADFVVASGLTGVVCSPLELKYLAGRGLFLLTPGIRFEDDDKGDQKRVAGPKEALAQGSSALVVGRPILQAANPRDAARRFVEACS